MVFLIGRESLILLVFLCIVENVKMRLNLIIYHEDNDVKMQCLFCFLFKILSKMPFTFCPSETFFFFFV